MKNTQVNASWHKKGLFGRMQLAAWRCSPRFLLCAILIGGFVHAVGAEQIAIGEPGFEGAGGRGTRSLPPWRNSFNGGNVIGIESYSHLGTNTLDAVPGGGFYLHYNNNASESIYQVLTTNLVGNTTYRLSAVAIDRTGDDHIFQPCELRLGYVPGTDDGSTGDTIANHFFGEYLITATVLTNTIPVNGAEPDDGYVTWVSDFKVQDGDPGVGHPIRIEIVSPGGVQSLFDNISLEAIPGPPAGTVVVIR